MEFYQAARERRRQLRRRHRGGAAAHPRRSRVRLSRRAGAGRSRRRARAIAISDLALASRLSFFLWSSIPDDELIDLAAQGTAQGSGGARAAGAAHAARIRSREALIANFTGQWLSVRSLKTSEPVVNLFPDFDDNLRSAFQREIELFFASIVQEDRSVARSADGRTTRSSTSGWRSTTGSRTSTARSSAASRCRPELDMRRGLLGKGALLTVTSSAARTSPVTRGKWFLQTFLGVEPPRSAADVPALKERAGDTTGNAKPPTMRADAGDASHRTRRARRATRSSSRWASRSRTSTPSAPGGRRTRACRSTRPACSSTARRSTASSSLRERAREATRTSSCASSPRSC